MSEPGLTAADRLRGFITPRQWAVDANDGIVATAGVLEGFAGAGLSDQVLMTAASALMVAGSLGLGGAKWAEEAAERDAQLALIREEALQLAADPAAEQAELVTYWEEKGLTPALAREVTAQLSARDPLAAQLEFEHDIDAPTPAWQPAFAGLTSGFAFLLGSLIPLLITVFVPVAIEAWVILGAVVVSLTLTSLVAARTGHLPLGRTLARTLAVGVVTLGVSYLAGRLFF